MENEWNIGNITPDIDHYLILIEKIS